MPHPYIVLLVEDKQHEAFARRFLYGLGWKSHQIDPRKIGDRPRVIREFAKEVIAIRPRRRSNVRLVVVIDADNDELDVLRRELVGPKSPVAREFREVENIVALFLPKRNIETWIRFLEGSPVDESTPYPKDYKGRERKCAEAVRTLVRHCQSGIFPSPPPSSLARACEEFDRVLRS